MASVAAVEYIAVNTLGTEEGKPGQAGHTERRYKGEAAVVAEV
ncbi:hypothetical protein P8936_07280 [Edaphobacter paludis]|uniref:Uncharacterized protein n=1 Tax=Edaphobacter paludis TaxID=3035702 RepID=A0AAU7D1E1_9BACT